MRATTAPEHVPAIYAPPTFDLDHYLGRLNSTLFEHAHYRRLMTRTDPLLFALLYFEHHLISPETGGRDVHLSQFHIDLAEAAKRWMRHNILPAEIREAWISPRFAAKTTWLIAPILPLWALAHGHRRFYAMFGASGPAIAQHMYTMRTELQDNALLRHDYPDLCTPAKTGGRSRSDTRSLYVARSGAAIMSVGIDSRSLGAKLDNVRPDLIGLDDVERDEGNYSPGQKASRLATISNAILPMNDKAVVQWAGTTTMFGSLIHDLVRHAHGQRSEWVDEDGWTARYYPPIVVRPDGTEDSMWPARWSLEHLRSIQHTRSYALNFANNPRSIEQGLWTPMDIVYVDNAPVTHQVLSIDPAVTTKAHSDYTGLAVVSWGARLVVEWATQLRLQPDELKRMVSQVLRENPRLTTVLVETNQGGENWSHILAPVIPRGIELVEVNHSIGKAGRFERLLDFYQMRRVVHARKFQVLEDQMLGYPKIEHDDCLDAVASGCEHLLSDQW